MSEIQEDPEAPRLDALFKFAHGHRVRYEEVDAQGIVGSAHWLGLLQLGRVEYLRYLGLLLEGGAKMPVQAVVRRTTMDHLAPARFDDPLAIRVRIAALGTRSAKVEYIVDNVGTGLRPLVAETLLICVEMSTFRSTPWPEFWRDRVREFEGENLILGQG